MCAKFKTTFRLPGIKVPVKLDSHRKRECVQSSPPNGSFKNFKIKHANEALIGTN